MMKRMKQISALLLVLLMMTALCGCGGSMAPAGGAMDYPAAEAAYERNAAGIGRPDGEMPFQFPIFFHGMRT